MRCGIVGTTISLVAIGWFGGCSGIEEEMGMTGGGPGIVSITSGNTSGNTQGTEASASDSDGGETDDSGFDSTSGMGSTTIKFDIGGPPETTTSSTTEDPCANTGTEGCSCSIPEHTPCDNGPDPFKAMGINCPGEFQVNTSTEGSPEGIGVRTSFGANVVFNPREGASYAVIGSGKVIELDIQTPPGDPDLSPTNCNDDLGPYDKGQTLPAPIMTNNVGGDCTQNMGLLGTGDCSNTIQGQFNQGGSANDYTELRFTAQVPQDVTSFSYDFAFFTTEWPAYAGSSFNDMYIGWLTSELWTGNISFDQNGNPISLNAGFLAYQDNGANLPEFTGTCMRQHAGTKWLQSTTGVVPGETITVVFAIFDLSDSILDSYAFLDNFQWGCEPSGQPSTEPIG